MNIICVDDENLMLKSILTKLKGLPDVDLVEGFRSGQEALDYATAHPVDIAFLDINMPEMDGLTLAKKLKQQNPRISIVFTTGYEEYALKAFSVRATGYLLKPFTKDKLIEEIANIKAQQGIISRRGITVQTFGDFEVFVDHQIVHFHRSKSKEILAILVDHKGECMTSAQIAEYLWEEGEYDRSRQKQMSVFLNELSSSLADAGAEEMLVRNRSALSLDITTFNCDYYALLEGNEAALNAYRGEYMKGYDWAEETRKKLEAQNS